MIAAQMLACHDTAMARFRDALNSKLHGRLWHEYLEQAGKLSRTFAMLLDALNRHRGKGQQKITVEHVQAVVGIVGVTIARVGRNGRRRKTACLRLLAIRASSILGAGAVRSKDHVASNIAASMFLDRKIIHET